LELKLSRKTIGSGCLVVLNRKHTSEFAVAKINPSQAGNIWDCSPKIKQAGKGASPIEAVAGVWHPPFLEMENKTSFTNPLATYVC
jgi:hypothetical protein